ncbi:ABC transporter permease [Leifsonia sp. AG29]|uniref:ABC transporter permease n=1 Tax=Leifsonia sp. AG29 TaxID=2598860 RepID=UPI00131AC5F3|nr:ABC transporter permease [Leifsonia sp. AG29]
MHKHSAMTQARLRTRHRAWISLVLTGFVIGIAFIGVYVGLQRSPAPYHVPIAVVGDRLAASMQRALGSAGAVTRSSSLSEALRGLDAGRYDAVVGSSSGRVTVEYAGAKGLSESSAALAMIQAFSARSGQPESVKDAVPLVSFDSRGLASFYVVFGVTLSSFVLTQGLTAAAQKIRLRHRLYAMLGFALAIGAVAATIAGPVFGALPAPWIALAVTLSLLSAAVAFTTKALGAWFGAVGFALAILMMTTVGNAVSGAMIGFDLLPGWARPISAALPPGAAVRAVTEFGYFHGASAWSSLVVLALWAAVAFALVLLRGWAPKAARAIGGGSR